MTETPSSEYSLRGKRVWVSGHSGMAGGALVRRLETEDCKILTVGHKDLDQIRQAEVEEWMEANRPHAVILAAATVGGIYANETRPGEFIYDNLLIGANVIEAARKTGVEKLLFLGSACIYPRLAPQPVNEEALLTGPLEPTNESYAISKIAGIKMCQTYRKQYSCDFISAQPNSLYGPGDNFDLESCHVVPALIHKAHEAKIGGKDSLEVWGSGKPLREFLYVEDLADALVFLMKGYSGPLPINIGSGEELSIRELANTVKEVVGFEGKLSFDSGKPDGIPRKLLDNTRINEMGWKATTPLSKGLRLTYEWALENQIFNG